MSFVEPVVSELTELEFPLNGYELKLNGDGTSDLLHPEITLESSLRQEPLP